MKETKQTLMIGLFLATGSFVLAFALMNSGSASAVNEAIARPSMIEATSGPDWNSSAFASRVPSVDTGWLAGLQLAIVTVREIHPITLAAMQIMMVLIICVLFTDNEELEIYLKIDFRPPQVDILN